MMDLSRLYTAADASGILPPVETWHPPFCGDIDMVIGRDGTWFYNGSPVERPALVQLFGRILRKEDGRYFLVTPVEKVGITVEDVPFIAVEMTGDPLTFRTDAGDTVTAGPNHALRFETGDGFKPYIHVRNGLEARLSRSLSLDLADMITVEDGWLGIRSGWSFFRISPAETGL